MKYKTWIVALFFIFCTTISLADNKFPIFVDSLLDAIVESENSKKDVLLIFSADWCKFCRVMKKDIDNNIRDLNGIIISYVDVDKDPELAKEFKVKQLPDYIILRNKIEIKRKVGYKNFETFKRWLKDND